MEPKPDIDPTATNWNAAKGLLSFNNQPDRGLHGALIPDTRYKRDHIAVVYDKGQMPPKITIEEISGSVHKVLANGIAVAVVASTTSPAPCVHDVLLVERST